MTLWYFETVSPLGHWTPNTAPDAPAVRKQAGVLRLGINGVGPRIRAIQPVPAELAELNLNDLQARLSPDAGGTEAATRECTK